MEEPDEDSSRAVHALSWDNNMRRGMLSRSPRLAARRGVVGGVKRVGRKEEKDVPKLVLKYPATAGPALLVRSQPHTGSPGEPSPARTAAVREGHEQRRISGTGQWRPSSPAVPHGREEDQRGRVCRRHTCHPRPFKADADCGTCLPP